MTELNVGYKKIGAANVWMGTSRKYKNTMYMLLFRSE